MPTTTREPLARHPQIEVAEIPDLRRRALALYRDLTARPDLRAGMDRAGLRERRHQLLRSDGRRGAEILATEMAELIAAGATHAEIEELLAWVSRVAEDAFGAREGRVLPPLLEAEIAEAEADVQEDATQPHVIRQLAAGKHLTTREIEERLTQLRRQAGQTTVLLRVLESEHRRRQLGLYDRRAS